MSNRYSLFSSSPHHLIPLFSSLLPSAFCLLPFLLITSSPHHLITSLPPSLIPLLSSLLPSAFSLHHFTVLQFFSSSHLLLFSSSPSRSLVPSSSRSLVLSFPRSLVLSFPRSLVLSLPRSVASSLFILPSRHHTTLPQDGKLFVLFRLLSGAGSLSPVRQSMFFQQFP